MTDPTTHPAPPPDAARGGTTQPEPYWLNGIPEFHWEICRGNAVVETIHKCADDGNRSDAEARVAELNAAPLPPPLAAGTPARTNIRVGVAAFVYRGDKVLMIQRAGAHGAGTWSIPGGCVETGELPEDAVLREVGEETGLRLLSVRFVGYSHYSPPDQPGTDWLTLFYEAYPDEGEAVNREPDKCSAMEWHPRWCSLRPLFGPLEAFVTGRSKRLVSEPVPVAAIDADGERQTVAAPGEAEGSEQPPQIKRALRHAVSIVKAAAPGAASVCDLEQRAEAVIAALATAEWERDELRRELEVVHSANARALTALAAASESGK